jgi:hypothetical protein
MTRSVRTKEPYGAKQRINWYFPVMTFLVTQEVFLMAFVKFPYSLSTLGNAILAFGARKE